MAVGAAKAGQDAGRAGRRACGWRARLAAALIAMPLAACSGAEAPSRAAAPAALVPPGAAVLPPGAEVLRLQYDVAAVQVRVPPALTVSEANRFYPLADIVWRGEPPGNRHAQVEAIVREGIARATGDMTSGPRVLVEAEVTRFHSLTEKARYTTGGVHAVHLTLTVRDAATGAVIDGPRPLEADVKASGGAQAMLDDQLGITMRVVIVDRLAQVVRRALAAPVDPSVLAAAAAGPAPVLSLAAWPAADMPADAAAPALVAATPVAAP
jgi:hypothetical protein